MYLSRKVRLTVLIYSEIASSCLCLPPGMWWLDEGRPLSTNSRLVDAGPPGVGEMMPMLPLHACGCTLTGDEEPPSL